MEISKTSLITQEFSQEQRYLPIKRLITGKSNAFGVGITIFSYLLFFGQYQEVIPILGKARLPVIICTIAGFVWFLSMTKNFSIQIKILILFLGIELIRNSIGWLVFDELVSNDFYSFNIWKDLVCQYFGLVFPVAVFIVTGAAIKKFYYAVVFSGFFLGLYAITHSGVGPGGFMGDENDTCQVLDFLLPFSLAILIETKQSIFAKIMLLGVSIIMVGGIFVSLSRGGFIGFICVLVYFFVRSKHKIALLFAALFIFGVATSLAPKGYFTEMQTISDTEGGTAGIRRYYWRLARMAWMDNPIMGVAMGNGQFHIGKYQTTEELRHVPSAQGRAVHSMFFQLLLELGIWGIVIVGSLLWTSLTQNKKSSTKLMELEQLLSMKRLELSRQNDQDTEEFLKGKRTLNLVLNEILFQKAFMLSMNISLIAIFTSGAFISTLYYPPLWLFFGLSASMSYYVKRLDNLSRQTFLEKS